MAQLTLTQLIGALQGSAIRAQVQAQMTTRDLVTTYAGDSILQAFNVPGFAVDSIEFSVPTTPVELQQISGGESSYAILGVTVVANPASLSATKRESVISILKEDLGKSEVEAGQLVDKLKATPQLLAFTTDVSFANELRDRMASAGVEVTLEESREDLQLDEILLDTDIADGVSPMTILVKLKPADFKVVRDGSADGDKFLVEPTG